MSDNPFNILGSDKVPTNGGQAVNSADKSLALGDQIKGLITSSDIFVFMKGTPDMPMCGFSANTTAILNSMNVPYKTFNILSDDDIRQGVKEFSNWPTYPQVYFKGQLIGGNDVVTEMYHNGELDQLFNS